MRVPLSWLREYVAVDLPVAELAHRLTMAGVEVGSWETVGADWQRITIGRVDDLTPHPRNPGWTLAALDLGDGRATLVTAATNLHATAGADRVIELAEAVCGYLVVFGAIGYLPALFQAYSRREVAVSQLDPRAGSPPSPGTLLYRAAKRGGWVELDSYLADWENPKDFDSATAAEDAGEHGNALLGKSVRRAASASVRT